MPYLLNFLYSLDVFKLLQSVGISPYAGVFLSATIYVVQEPANSQLNTEHTVHKNKDGYIVYWPCSLIASARLDPSKVLIVQPVVTRFCNLGF